MLQGVLFENMENKSFKNKINYGVFSELIVYFGVIFRFLVNIGKFGVIHCIVEMVILLKKIPHFLGLKCSTKNNPCV